MGAVMQDLESQRVMRARIIAGEQIAAEARREGLEDPHGGEQPPSWSVWQQRLKQIRERRR